MRAWVTDTSSCFASSRSGGAWEIVQGLDIAADARARLCAFGAELGLRGGAGNERVRLSPGAAPWWVRQSNVDLSNDAQMTRK